MNQGKSSPVVLITLVTFGVGQITPYFSKDRSHDDPVQLFHQPHTHQEPPPGNPATGRLSMTVASGVTSLPAAFTVAQIAELLRVYHKG